MKLCDACICPKRFPPGIGVFLLARIQNKTQSVKVEGAQQVVTSLLMVQVQMVEKEHASCLEGEAV